MRGILFLCTGFVVLQSCNNAEIANGKDVEAETIYYDYKIWGDEEAENVSVMLQYRFGGKNGTTLILDSPSTVTLDGSALALDSAALAGAFYESTRPAGSFAGKHQIVFTDRDGKVHKEEFDYKPFKLLSELPEKLKRDSFTIRLTGVDERLTRLRLVMTDTAFNSADFNEELRVSNGEIKIKPAYWRNLKNGPVNLDIYQEGEWPLKNTSKEGGRLSVVYSLKRQFELTD